MTGGSPTTLASGVTQGLASGDEVAIRVVGSTVAALHYVASSGTWNQVLSYDTSGDATRYTAAGSLALEFKTSTIDDFGGGTLGGGGGGGTQPPVNSTPPSISGSTTVGSTLTASSGTWSGSPSFTYQFQRCNPGCGSVGGNTASSTYALTAADVGATIQVVVTATNGGGSAQATSAAVGPVTSSGGGGGGGTGPTGSLLDDFNRANGGAGSNWASMRSGTYATMNVSSNAAVDSSSTQFAWNFWSPATFADGSAYVTVATYGASDTIRVGARVTNGGTTTYSGYFVSVNSSGAWSIIRVDNGGSPGTLKSGATQTIAAGDKIGIEVTGTVVTAWFNRGGTWTQELTYDTAGDATKYSSGKLALEFKTSTLDDFSGG
jgi:hypothetical protein